MDEHALTFLLTAMIREGVIPEHVALDAADEAQAMGHSMSALQIRAMWAEAHQPPRHERQAEQGRASMRVIDGGNSSDH